MTDPLNPDDLDFEALEKAIENIRLNYLFGSQMEALDSPYAEQHALQALSYLELAQRSVVLARMHEAQAHAPPGARAAT